MPRYGVALDLGTSGLRGQAIELETGEVVATAITARHPVPGANVMDHLTFAVEAGVDLTHEILIAAVNQVIMALGIPVEACERLAVCGNPIQLSLFEGIEIRDLAYAGERKRQLLGIQPPNRDGKALQGARIRGLNVQPDCLVLIPPAVKHEIGADALALMVKSGMLERDEIALATDYGTNAEMALKVGDKIITGSCAAGPALEGQHVSQGMLAAPGAISDLNPEGEFWRCTVLDETMMPDEGPLVDLDGGRLINSGVRRPAGITGTGVIALVYQGTEAGLINLPRIATRERKLGLGYGIFFTEQDLKEAGKAIGALRAGYLTLAYEAGIEVEQIRTAYMAGASGTYVDARKAHQLGMVPPRVARIYQIGNTSLALARDLVVNPGLLGELQQLAVSLRATHSMFAQSPVFERAYLLELSYWGEGMPWDQYLWFSRLYKLPLLPSRAMDVQVYRLVARDIADLGMRGLTLIEQVGQPTARRFGDCNLCGTCVEECPEQALSFIKYRGETLLQLRPDRCNGMACLRCERACPVGALHFVDLCYRWMGCEDK